MYKTFLPPLFLSLILILATPQLSFCQNVGVGTATPFFKLDVRNGSINTDSIYRINFFPVLSIAGTSNLFVGQQAGQVNTGAYNMFAGMSAGLVNTTGSFNTFAGTNAGIFNTIGSLNSFFGMDAGFGNTSGSYNCFFGMNAGGGTKGGSSNCFFGGNAGIATTSGYSNVGIGKDAMYSNVLGTNIIAIGDSALYGQTSYTIGTIAIGSKAGYSNNGDYNNFLGYQAGYSNQDGSANLFAGFQSGYSNTNGGENVFLGFQAAQSNTSGDGHVIIGYKAGSSTTTGHHNSFIGELSGYTNTTGSHNSFLGELSGYSNSTGTWNSFFGDSSGRLNSSGNQNTFVGYFAGAANTTGSRNSFFGSLANPTSVNLSYATAIGYHSQVNCSNCLVLGGLVANGEQTRVGINNTTPITDLHIIQQTDASTDKVRGIRLQRSINTNHWRTMIDPSNNYVFEYNDALYSYIEPVGATYVTSSDENLKRDILPLDNLLDKILQLRPASYYYKSNPANDRRSYGFLAQEVERLFPDFVFTSGNGIKGIAYSNFGVIAIKAIQEQQKIIETLQNRLEVLEERILRLEKK